jgi:hypothetical protein
MKITPVILAEEEISDVSLSTFYLRRLRRLRVGLLYLDWTCPRLLIAGDTQPDCFVGLWIASDNGDRDSYLGCGGRMRLPLSLHRRSESRILEPRS